MQTKSLKNLKKLVDKKSSISHSNRINYNVTCVHANIKRRKSTYFRLYVIFGHFRPKISSLVLL